MPLPGDPVAAGGRPAPKAKEIDPRAIRRVDEAQGVVGRQWESKAKDETYTRWNTRPMGSFPYTVETEGKAGKPVVGQLGSRQGQKITMHSTGWSRPSLLDVVLTAGRPVVL